MKRNFFVLLLKWFSIRVIGLASFGFFLSLRVSSQPNYIFTTTTTTTITSCTRARTLIFFFLLSLENNRTNLQLSNDLRWSQPTNNLYLLISMNKINWVFNDRVKHSLLFFWTSLILINRIVFNYYCHSIDTFYTLFFIFICSTKFQYSNTKTKLSLPPPPITIRNCLNRLSYISTKVVLFLFCRP